MIQEMLEAEMDVSLGYPKNEKGDSGRDREKRLGLRWNKGLQALKYFFIRLHLNRCAIPLNSSVLVIIKRT